MGSEMCIRDRYNSMGISNYPPLITEIYSNAMTSAYKNTEKHHLISMDLNFNDEAIEFVVLLELLKDFCNIKACDVLKLDKAISLFTDRYSDELFEKIIRKIKYPYSVVGMLEKRLAEKRTANRCIEIYKKIYG